MFWHGKGRDIEFTVERYEQRAVGLMVWIATAYGSQLPLLFIRILLPYLDGCPLFFSKTMYVPMFIVEQ